jgi:hypothetical protein
MATISCLLPSFKYPQYLHDAAWSVISQVEPVEELIILNNAFDRSMAEIEDLLFFSNIYVIRTGNINLTMVDKVNMMARMASSDYLFVLCEDDMIDKTFTQKILERIETSEVPVDLVYTDMEIFGMENRIVKPLPWCKESFERTTVPFITSVVSKRIWDRVGGWLEVPFADWDFWWRIFELETYWSIEYIPEPLFRFRTHPDQDSRTGNNEERTRIVRRLHGVENA